MTGKERKRGGPGGPPPVHLLLLRLGAARGGRRGGRRRAGGRLPADAATLGRDAELAEQVALRTELGAQVRDQMVPQAATLLLHLLPAVDRIPQPGVQTLLLGIG